MSFRPPMDISELNNVDYGITQVSFEESAMGKIQKELETQTEEFRQYYAAEKANREEDIAQHSINSKKEFRRGIIYAIVGAVFGVIFDRLITGAGFDIVDYILSFIHNLFYS